ncbi:hypothetical protein [Streptomyces sp. NBC_00654]|uniref:hypothetical protein n=1 Tax=Streptomyces sp. NBC_00654 TaxID=2975799 RepID=UPI00225B7328|nr:hypothetical protein [Streptomyces sp. NBC_00654]
MSKEVIISPRSEHVREELAEAAAWSAYAAELREVLGAAIEKSGADLLEVGGLLVSEPLPEEHRSLRNGAEVRPPQAIGLAEGMAAGRGPYCQLAAPGKLQIEPGWDGAVHLFTTAAVATDLAGRHGEGVTFLWRDAAPEPVEVSDPVDAVADAGFWARVAEASERLTLVCERWAYGAHGYRWFRVTPESTAEVARLLRPRSLVCVAAEPELNPRAELLQDDFTVFMAPLTHGELAHRNYPGGADTLSEVADDGFSLMLADAALADWCAVVPDTDGVARGQWETPGEY